MNLTKKNIPLVSVLIGTYNRSELISRCIDSVFRQTHKNIEVIVVDDNSTDNTLEILNNYKSKFPSKFKFISNKINKGIAYNSNLAYSMSSGDYLALVGDDDEWFDSSKIEIQLNEFYLNSKLGLVSTYWNDVKNGSIVKQHNPSVSKDPFSQILKANGVYCGSTVLITKDAWDLVGGFDERMKRGTDSEIFRSIIKKKIKTKIVTRYTTNVFIDDHFRMTPVISLESQKKALTSNLIILVKYFFDYLLKPIALLYRLKNILRILKQIIFIFIKK